MLAAAAPCTIFSPDDLALISGAPAGRRDLLDDTLALLDAEGARRGGRDRPGAARRAALLRQAGGRLAADAVTTLEVWDQRLADAGKVLVAARERLVGELDAARRGCLRDSPGRRRDRAAVTLRYQRSWDGDLADALTATPDGRPAAGSTPWARTATTW